jgi:hypothetical protein
MKIHPNESIMLLSRDLDMAKGFVLRALESVLSLEHPRDDILDVIDMPFFENIDAHFDDPFEDGEVVDVYVEVPHEREANFVLDSLRAGRVAFWSSKANRQPSVVGSIQGTVFLRIHVRADGKLYVAI